MANHIKNARTNSTPVSRNIDRRNFLWRFGGGLGGIALAHLLGQDGLLAGSHDDGINKRARSSFQQGPHYRPRARRVVQLFMSGAASQCDTFDHKLELIRRHGEKFDPGGKVELFQSDPGVCFKSPWSWRPRSQCGKMTSDLVPHIGSCADKIAFVHSMMSKSNVHGPATYMQNSGFVLPGFPNMGAWISYGLGSMNRNLPDFIVLPDVRGFAPNGPANWSAGFLPASHQGTMVRIGQPSPILNLFPHEAGEFITDQAEREGGRLLRQLDQGYLSSRDGDSRLDARIANYEMAASLQLSAPEVLDLRGETDSTKTLYGLDEEQTRDFGTRCLISRRLLERGVRFVQIWSGADNGFPRRNWDSHEDLAKDHFAMAYSMDRPTAALVKDLEARGLLDDTIILWTTEFGRMPCSQGGRGRDHNPFGFTNWLAGGGIKGGVSFGATDEWSYKAVENETYCYDIHATILHLLGINHEKLTFRDNGIDRRLTDVHGNVINQILS